MRKSNQEKIRVLLRREYTDGLTVAEIATLIGSSTRSTLRSLQCMPDAYIDRWQLARHQDAGVWCVVIPPENCPKPERKPK